MEMEKAILGIRARRAPESKESTESSSEGSVRGEEGRLEHGAQWHSFWHVFADEQ
jgi:hypothetical protein